MNTHSSLGGSTLRGGAATPNGNVHYGLAISPSTVIEFRHTEPGTVQTTVVTIKVGPGWG